MYINDILVLDINSSIPIISPIILNYYHFLNLPTHCTLFFLLLQQLVFTLISFLLLLNLGFLFPKQQQQQLFQQQHFTYYTRIVCFVFFLPVKFSTLVFIFIWECTLLSQWLSLSCNFPYKSSKCKFLLICTCFISEISLKWGVYF